MCFYCNSEYTYTPPTIGSYNPNINPDNVDRNKAKEIHRNCMTILHKSRLYCDSKGRLHGFHWINFPMRIWQFIKNYKTKGQLDRDVVQKITETFDFILNLNTGKYRIFPFEAGVDLENSDRCLSNTYFTLNINFYTPYTTLAKKIIRKYPQKQCPELFNLAHRILHERSQWIEKEIKEDVAGTPFQKPNLKHIVKVPNIMSRALGTPFERTTVWECT